MKKSTLYILFVVILFSTNVFSQSDKYSNGYQTGWEKGYCYESGYGCTSPIPPISPLPRIDESSYNYQDGYNRGFIDGQRGKPSKSSQSSNGGDMYAPANFGEYVQPIDVNLVANAMYQKQRNYNSERNSDYQVELDKAINSSNDLYNQVMKYLVENANLFSWAETYQENLKTYYDHNKIINKYPADMTYKQAGSLVGELQENFDALAETFGNIGKIVQAYIDNPNNVLQGYYEVQSIEDLLYNEKTKQYEHLKSIASEGKGSAYIQFGKNKISFKRPNSTPKIGALKFDKLEDGYYKFKDGHGQLILITKDNVFLNYFHTPNSKGEYTMKTSYLVMGGFNFSK